MTFLWALLAGAGAAIVYVGLCLAFARQHPLRLIEGFDGRLSTSKAQWFLWTAAVVFGYVAVYTARAVNGDHNALSNVPHNVLIALGFSTTTAVAAKGITAGYKGAGNVVKLPATSSSAADLVSDDSGTPDLSKTQLLIFTLIAVGIFIVNVFDQINAITIHGATAANSALPDIDTTLMILMGLSQGGYLGKKVVTTGTVGTLVPTSVSVAAGPALATIYGSGFGDPPAGVPVPDGCAVLLDGYAAPVTLWSDGRIQFTVDPAQPPVSRWPAGQTEGQVQVSVVVNGQPAGGALALKVAR
jgi:hypothetical protein